MTPGDYMGFGPRGHDLWQAMAEAQMGPAHRALLAEGCRLADRLDGFDRLLANREWFEGRFDDDGRVVVVVDALLAEARQHASALKVIVAQLEPKPKAAPAPSRPKSGAGVADLAARIAARRGAG